MDGKSLSLQYLIYFEVDITESKSQSRIIRPQPEKVRLEETLHRTFVDHMSRPHLIPLNRLRIAEVIINSRHRSTPYSWSSEITKQRSACEMNRKTLTRVGRFGNQTDSLIPTYKIIKSCFAPLS